ncbi:hypothetical protein D3C83_124490 [compost metagenome]
MRCSPGATVTVCVAEGAASPAAFEAKKSSVTVATDPPLFTMRRSVTKFVLFAPVTFPMTGMNDVCVPSPPPVTTS